MEYDESTLKEKNYSTPITINGSFEKLDLSPLFNYRVFPTNILDFFAEWEFLDRKMEPGDTIVQQINILPIKWFSPKIIVGVRIKQVIDQPTKKGFEYEALNGHVEKGRADFTIEQTENGIVLKIQTRSKPNGFFSKLVSSSYQSFVTKKALKHLKRELEAQVHN